MAKLYIIMGVSGAGKSTLASALAQHFGYHYLDADDFHSESAKAHMAGGAPLTDAMRKPWIERICTHLHELALRDESVVLAFSGLKKSHRDPLRECGLETHFLFLDGDAPTISERMSAREGHFMPPSLLDSQFESLERPDMAREPDIEPLSITPPIPGVLERAIELVHSLEEQSPSDSAHQR